MNYLVVVMRGEALANTLASALGSGRLKPRSVYVVGVSDESLLAAALAGDKVTEIEDPSTEEVLRFTFSEAIGTETKEMPIERLTDLAKRRIEQLQSNR